MNNEKLVCENCGNEMIINLNEFVDVTTDPIYKEQILNGSFFIASCAECGDETLVEYPLMYLDPSKKLTVYMAPEHEEDLLVQLNSLEIPEGDIDQEAIFRVVNNSTELLEKILLADNHRDDRIMELYKAIICENIKEELPTVQPHDLLYYKDEEENEEYFIIWDYERPEGEKLTINVDDELYEELKEKYLPALETEPNKYAEVNGLWLADKIEVEE
ncbi:ribosomal protein S27E [Clostridiales Family XIII bacterium PM5-7]